MFLQSFGQNQFNYLSSSEVSFNDPELIYYYEEFLQNQNQPFLNANSEAFVLDNSIWYRPFGETRYCLTPKINNIQNYENRINSENSAINNTNKSNFQFVDIEIINSTIELLKQVNIEIPKYVKSSVICYLPEIDIEFLIENGIKINELKDYGSQMNSFSKEGNSNNMSKALIWNEGFESNSVPGSVYNANNGSVNCGWSDVSCYSHGGSWSTWCAGNGAACNNCGSNYVNDMETYFATTNYISVSGYEDIFFNYWIDLDLNNSGTNDELRRYEDLGSGTWSLAFTATSANQWDGQLWQNGSISYTGQSFNQYAFSFGFVSNFTGTSYGVYLDDLQLTGTSTADIDESELNNSVKIYPNPSNGVFELEFDSSIGSNIQVSVSNMSGQIVYSNQIESINTNNKSIDLRDLTSGIYSINIISDNHSVNKKLVIE